MKSKDLRQLTDSPGRVLFSAEQADRFFTALEDAFGEALDWITPADALHYFQHAGYSGGPPGRN